MGKYQRYEKAYNRRTAPVASRSNYPWTVAEEARLLRVWCRATASAVTRIHMAQTLGRSYVACAKRHSYIHRRRDNWRACKADRRQRGS